MVADSLSSLENQNDACLHATCIALQGRGILIVGPSGAGKSALALQLMALGAQLVADDRVELTTDGGALIAAAVPPIRGLIEARGVGLLRAEPCGPVPVALVVDLDQPEPARLPDPLTLNLLGQCVPLLRAQGVPNLAAALIQLMKQGRVDPQWPSI